MQLFVYLQCQFNKMLLNHAWQCLIIKKMAVAHKNWAFFKCRALCPAFLKNGRRALALGIFKKNLCHFDSNIMAGLINKLLNKQINK